MHDESFYRMPFGAHKGQRLDTLPNDYLDWLRGLDDLRPRLRAEVNAEDERRSGSARRPVAAIAAAIITRGYRAVARECHPDAGGTHEAMIATTAAADWLRAQLRGLGA